MPIHDFNSFNTDNEQYSNIDNLPDNRTDIEKEFTPLSIFNHNKPDLALLERTAEEAINLCGAWVTLFIKEPISKGEGHPLDIWDEDPDPQYRNGIKIKGHVKFDQWKWDLTRWGIDSELTATVTFSRAIIGKTVGLGRMLNPGDVIEVPYNRSGSETPLRFRVKNEYESGAVNYRWLYYSTICELIPGDKSLLVPFKRQGHTPNTSEVRKR